MATYLYVLFAVLLPTALAPIRFEQMTHMLLLVFMVTFIFPVACIIALRMSGTISSLSIPNRRERNFPFLLISFLYILMTFFFYKKIGFTISDSFFKLLLILDALVIVATIVTFFYKISVHSMAIWCVLGILIPMNHDAADGILFYPILGVILLAGIVMWSRLYLQVHSFTEVMTGSVLGFLISFGLMVAFF